MYITLNGSDFNRIMRVCVPAVSHDTMRPGLCHILIECNGEGEGCATALDGFVLAQTRFPANGERWKMLLFPHGPVSEDCTVTLEYKDGRSSISDGEMILSRIVPAPGTYVKHHEVTKNTQKHKKSITITLNPPILKQILKCLVRGRSPLHLDIYGPNDPIVVHSDNGAGLLLPMRTAPEFAQEPDFWEMIEDG